MSAASEAREAFARIAAQEGPDLPLDEAMAWIAAEETPGVDALALVAALDQLARGVYVREGAPVHEIVARLNHHLFETHGFAGDVEDYGAPRNSLLDQVLARRRGLPILLSIVYLEVARRVGAAFEGVGFPGHFLVAPRVGPEETRFFVDPFHQGRILRESQLRDRVRDMAQGRAVPEETLAQLLSPVRPRYVLVRVNNNLKGAWLRAGDVGAALRSVERLLLLEPGLLEERRDRGLMLAHLGQAEAGLVELRRYLDDWPDAPDRARIERRVAELERATGET